MVIVFDDLYLVKLFWTKNVRVEILQSSFGRLRRLNFNSNYATYGGMLFTMENEQQNMFIYLLALIKVLKLEK